MAQITDTFSMVQILQQTASLNQDGSVTIQLPPQVYRLSKTKFQVLFKCPDANANKFGRIVSRMDCLPAALQCQITLDGQQIMNVQNLNILQYQHFWRYLSTDKDQCYSAIDGQKQADRSKKAIQILGIKSAFADSAVTEYCASFDLNHFLGGLFQGEEYLHVQNQLVITLQLKFVSNDNSAIAFQQGSDATLTTALASSSNSTNCQRILNNASATTAVQEVRCRILACVPQLPPQVQKKFQTVITQYSAQSASSLNFTYVPQGGILFGIHFGFQTNIQQAADLLGVTFPDTIATNEDVLENAALTQRVTYNGLQLIQASGTIKKDFNSQLRALATSAMKQDSCANEAFMDVRVSGEQIQIQVTLGTAVPMQSITFYESVPVMASMIQ